MSNLIANWPAPPTVCALTTTREGGDSPPPYQSNNLGYHVGDDEINVRENRRLLVESLSLSKEPAWLEQTHTNHCVVIDDDKNRLADAAITRCKDTPLVIMTADCLPILLCNRDGTEIAAIHCGWRGLVNGIVENTLVKMKSSPDQLMAWMGPAICKDCFEVGEDVLKAYTNSYPFTESAFRPHGSRWLADLPKLGELILNEQGVKAVYHSSVCTLESKNQFYSYRREAKTGRMATLIWINSTVPPSCE